MQVGVQGTDQNSLRLPKTCDFQGKAEGMEMFNGMDLGGTRVARDKFVLCGGPDKNVRE